MNKQIDSERQYAVLVEQVQMVRRDLTDFALDPDTLNLQALRRRDKDTCRNLADFIEHLRDWAALRDEAWCNLHGLRDQRGPSVVYLHDEGIAVQLDGKGNQRRMTETETAEWLATHGGRLG